MYDRTTTDRTFGSGRPRGLLVQSRPFLYAFVFYTLYTILLYVAYRLYLQTQDNCIIIIIIIIIILLWNQRIDYKVFILICATEYSLACLIRTRFRFFFLL